jgi:hypothetical protein
MDKSCAAALARLCMAVPAAAAVNVFIAFRLDIRIEILA